MSVSSEMHGMYFKPLFQWDEILRIGGAEQGISRGLRLNTRMPSLHTWIMFLWRE